MQGDKIGIERILKGSVPRVTGDPRQGRVVENNFHP